MATAIYQDQRMFDQQNALNSADGQATASAGTSAPVADQAAVASPGADSSGTDGPPIAAQPLNGLPTAITMFEPGGLATGPITGVLNQTILDLHADLEGADYQAGTEGTVHFVTNLGETIGLGRIGDSNLVTDVLDTPTGLLAGNLSPITNIPHDVLNIVAGIETLPQDVAADLANGMIGHNLPGVYPYAVHGVIDSISNVQTLVDDVLGPVLPHTVEGLANLEASLGIGPNGGHGLVSDIVMTPFALLEGDPSAKLEAIPSDLSHALGAAEGLINDLGLDLGHGTPVLGALGNASGPLNGVLGGAGGLGILGDGGPLGGILHGSGGGPLDGLLGSNQGGPLGGILHGEGGSGIGGLLNGHVLGSGLLGGLLGTGEGQPGDHNLVTAAAGPEAPNGGLLLNLLTPTGDSSHAVDVNAINAPHSAPMIANLSLLTDSLHLPSGGGGLTDALSGILDNGLASHAAIPVAAPPPTSEGPSFDHIVVPLVPTLSDVVQPQHHALV